MKLKKAKTGELKAVAILFIAASVALIIGNFTWEILLGVSSFFVENDNLEHGVTIELKIWHDSPLGKYTTHSKSVLNGTCRNSTFVKESSFPLQPMRPPTASKWKPLVDPYAYNRSYECVDSYAATKWEKMTMEPVPNMLVNGKKVTKEENTFFGDYRSSYEKEGYRLLRSLIIGMIIIFVAFKLINITAPAAKKNKNK